MTYVVTFDSRTEHNWDDEHAPQELKFDNKPVNFISAVTKSLNGITKTRSGMYDLLKNPLPLGYSGYLDNEDMKDVQQAIQSVKNAIAYMEDNKKDLEPEMYNDVVGKLANLLQVHPSKVESMIEGGGADLSFLERIKREQFQFEDGNPEGTKHRTVDQDGEVL